MISSARPDSTITPSTKRPPIPAMLLKVQILRAWRFRSRLCRPLTVDWEEILNHLVMAARRLSQTSTDTGYRGQTSASRLAFCALGSEGGESCAVVCCLL